MMNVIEAILEDYRFDWLFIVSAPSFADTRRFNFPTQIEFNPLAKKKF